MKINHIAVVCKGCAEWSLKKRKKLSEGYSKLFSNVNEIIRLQIKKNIPITTFYLMPLNVEGPDDYMLLSDSIKNFLDELNKNDILRKNRIKISILGKWYNLPSRIIDSVKKIIDDTKDYDGYFVNFCIGYDGQEEIVDACKMIARRVKLGKFDADSINKETIKEDLYSSYFMPPNTIFVSGKENSLKGFLLWDSVDSKIVFLEKNFPDVKVKEIEKSLNLHKS